VNVVGTLCENNDWFAKQRELPVGIALGDLFVIHDTGAHAHSMGFQYNGKLRAPEVIHTITLIFVNAFNLCSP
jgi:diaminopimelate decarboxylase